MADPAIPGLFLHADLLSASQQREALQRVDASPWTTDLKRRTQHHGWRYDYHAREIDVGMRIGALPDWLFNLARRLFGMGWFHMVPNQVIANEYLPGQGIAPHADNPAFGPTVATISLGDEWEIDFRPNWSKEPKISLALPPGSALVLSGDARWRWRHGIAPRRNETVGGVREAEGKAGFADVPDGGVGGRGGVMELSREFEDAIRKRCVFVLRMTVVCGDGRELTRWIDPRDEPVEDPGDAMYWPDFETARCNLALLRKNKVWSAFLAQLNADARVFVEIVEPPEGNPMIETTERVELDDVFKDAIDGKGRYCIVFLGESAGGDVPLREWWIDPADELAEKMEEARIWNTVDAADEHLHELFESEEWLGMISRRFAGIFVRVALGVRRLPLED